jgi:hypothetical protein
MRATSEKRVLLVLKGHKVSLAYKVNKDQLVQPVPKVQKVTQEKQVLLAFKGLPA